MVFNPQHGKCPAWLPLSGCHASYSCPEQVKWSRSCVASFYRMSKTRRGKKRRFLPRLQIKQFTHNWGPWLKSSRAGEIIKNVTSHKGEHKQFLFPLLCSGSFPFSLLTHADPRLYESQERTEMNWTTFFGLQGFTGLSLIIHVP